MWRIHIQERSTTTRRFVIGEVLRKPRHVPRCLSHRCRITRGTKGSADIRAQDYWSGEHGNQAQAVGFLGVGLVSHGVACLVFFARNFDFKERMLLTCRRTLYGTDTVKFSCCLAIGTDNQSTDVVLRLKIARSRGGCQLGRFANAFCCALRFLLCAGWLLSL